MRRDIFLKQLTKNAAKKWKQKARDKEKFGDYTIVEYMGKTPSEKNAIPLHRVKLRCKCGFEKIVARQRLNKYEKQWSKCDRAHHRDFLTKSILFNSWFSMNRVCNPKLSFNPNSHCRDKKIRIYPEWCIESGWPYRELYKSYEAFILALYKFTGWDIQDLIDKKIRVLRIDKNEIRGFYPYNLKLKHKVTKKDFIPNVDHVMSGLIEMEKIYFNIKTNTKSLYINK